MRTLAVVNETFQQADQGQVSLSGIPINLGTVTFDRPEFNPSLPQFRDRVLVRVEAFSCNYRDKAILIDAALGMADRTWPRSNHFGSEFAGVVVDAGIRVEDFKPGDRVMPDASYPDAPAPGESPGIVTNAASQGWLILHPQKLLSIPQGMSITDAAGFSLAAQTAFGMMRQAQLEPNSTAMVASARSSTGLGLIRGLLSRGVKVVAVSSREWTVEERKIIDPSESVIFFSTREITEPRFNYAFDAIFDFFTDQNFGRFIKYLVNGGRYVTCGFKNQHSVMHRESDANISFSSVLAELIVGNKLLIGNCIGTKIDLVEAVDHYADVAVPIDSTFELGQSEKFISRTFNEPEKFGKVIFRYT